MIKRHDFQQAARHFRAGRISLDEFTDRVFGPREEEGDGQSNAQTVGLHIRLPERPDTAHKGDFGRVLAIGGSVGMAGAIAMSAQAALRSGSGLVVVITPESVANLAASFSPCPMVVPAPAEHGMLGPDAKSLIQQRLAWADVVAIGPGMGRSETGQKLCKWLYRDVSCPMVVDADALNNLADAGVDLAQHAGPRILTPHPGEFIRLIQSEQTQRSELERQATELSERCNLVVVLKGHQTLVAAGGRSRRNESGNSGMATGGSGDVLTGVIAALVGQKLTPADAAVTGCHVHGAAGDVAKDQIGAISMIATDLLGALPAAFANLAEALRRDGGSVGQD